MKRIGPLHPPSPPLPPTYAKLLSLIGQALALGWSPTVYWYPGAAQNCAALVEKHYPFPCHRPMRTQAHALSCLFQARDMRHGNALDRPAAPIIPCPPAQAAAAAAPAPAAAARAGGSGSGAQGRSAAAVLHGMALRRRTNGAGAEAGRAEGAGGGGGRGRSAAVQVGGLQCISL